MIYVQAVGVLAVLGVALTALLLVANKFLCDYGECSVKVNDREPFVIEGGCSLLEALYEQQIFIPSACGGQGTCGFCKVNVLDGGGPVLPTELPYLSETEVAEKVRLACQVKVKQNLEIKVRADYLEVKEFKGKIASARLVTHDTREIVIDLIEPETIDFKPGQYVQVLVPGKGPATFRAYSISSPPSNTKQIELLVRLIPGGLGSTYLHEIQEGEELTFTGPYGEFELDISPETELICVGGGCGMAPMRSILRHVSEVAPGKACKLFFGARTTADLMYQEEFSKLAEDMATFEACFALSEPTDEDKWDGPTGFIHESVDRVVSTNATHQAFLCGPPLMIEATMKVLREKTVPDDRVFYDEF